jgi:hypothetical protein
MFFTSLKLFLTSLLLTALVTSGLCQETEVTGVVKDARNKLPLAYVTVSFKGGTIQTKTDQDGSFKIKSPEAQTTLQLDYIGYKRLLKAIKPNQSQDFVIQMTEESQQLTEVKITAGKSGPYRNKNNPAVELIRNVIDRKPFNRMEAYDQVSYKQYERLQVSLSNLSNKFVQKKLFRKYQFMFTQQDSDKIGGKNMMPVYLQEKLSDNYYRKNPEKRKSIILADKHVNFDSDIIDNKGLSVYLNRMYADINIYDNDLLIATTEFLSPIANSAPTFYKYFITDTIKTVIPQLIELSFIPRNAQDLLFTGRMYVTNDRNYAVTSVSLEVGKSVNLNFAREVEVKQNFEQQEDKKYHLSKSDLIVDFGISQNKGKGLTGQRTIVLKDFKPNLPIPDTVFNGRDLLVSPEAEQRNESYWTQNRLDTVPASTLKIYGNIDSLGKSKSFKTVTAVAGVFFAGYYNTGKFEIGPTYTFYNFNSIEGLKLRFGGRTTTDFSTRYYFDGYAAYGFQDERWKGYFSAAYAFNNKSIYSFPQSFIRASVQRDLYVPGQELRSNSEDDFVSSFKRGVNNRYLYNDFYRIQYVKEFQNNFSFDLGFRRWTQSPAGSLVFNYPGQQKAGINQITTSEFNLALRYAPHEQFYQGKRTRVVVNSKNPIFNLRYAAGFKGLFGGEYNYQNIAGTIDKRLYLSQFGITDVKLEGGYIFNKVPYPLLAIHRANQSYAYQINAYNLMNFLEFVSDHYAAINIDHGFAGFFLNKVPLLKHLQLREYVSFKAVYGGVRQENDPSRNSDLLPFPVNSQGIQTTYTFGRLPYAEGSVGLGNIFKFLRIDFVKRFNYLDHPDVPSYGIRAKIRVEL